MSDENLSRELLKELAEIAKKMEEDLARKGQKPYCDTHENNR